MPTIETAMQYGIRERLEKDKNYRNECFDAIQSLRKNDPEILIHFEDNSDMPIPIRHIFNHSWGNSFDVVNDVMVAILWGKIITNSLCYTVFQVRESPHRDACHDKNNDILQDMIEYYNKKLKQKIFKNAKFYGGPGDADGFIEFYKPPIKQGYCQTCTSRKQRNSTQWETYKHAVGGICTCFPLEVGYCKPYQVLWSLFQSGCVARFPYGYNLIFFFEDVARTVFSNMTGDTMFDIDESVQELPQKAMKPKGLKRRIRRRKRK